MSEKHKCCNCPELISLFRAFCSRNCREEFFKKYPEAKEDEK